MFLSDAVAIQVMKEDNKSYQSLKYSWDEFKSRVELSLDMFRQIEEEVNDFLAYVPLDFNHLNVYSLKLVKIMLGMGPEILSSFDLATFPACLVRVYFPRTNDEIDRVRKELFEEETDRKKKNQSLTFKHYYDFLHLASSIWTHRLKDSIRLKDLDAYVVPFERFVPKWWQSHNLLKHDKYSSFRKATLANTLKALGALFWLAEHNSRAIGMREFHSAILSWSHKVEIASLRKIC